MNENLPSLEGKSWVLNTASDILRLSHIKAPDSYLDPNSLLEGYPPSSLIAHGEGEVARGASWEYGVPRTSLVCSLRPRRDEGR